jgi:hypothetical protein
MKLGLVLLSLAFLCLNCEIGYAKCLAIPVQVQGEIAGNVQEGDALLLQFVYSPKRIETSSAKPVTGQAFTLAGAYSTYKRRGLFSADVCSAAPGRIQLVMKDRDGETLDTVDLTVPDEKIDRVTEIRYGKKQPVVVHPRRVNR